MAGAHPPQHRPWAAVLRPPSFGAEAAENRDAAASFAQNAKPIPTPPHPPPLLQCFKHGSTQPGTAQQQAACVTRPWGDPAGLWGSSAVQG